MDVFRLAILTTATHADSRAARNLSRQEENCANSGRQTSDVVVATEQAKAKTLEAAQ